MSDTEEARPRTTPPGRLVVLVADDNERFRAGMVRALSRRPDVARVLDVCDGAEALHALRSVRVDAVIADARMPNVDGLALARLVLADPAIDAVPVLVMSAEVGAGLRAAALKAGAIGFVDKAAARSEICEAALAAAVVRPPA